MKMNLNLTYKKMVKKRKKMQETQMSRLIHTQRQKGMSRKDVILWTRSNMYELILNYLVPG